jgi:hypothetical protein
MERLEGRAGLASALYSLKMPPKVIAAILRHDPLTSWKYYIDARRSTLDAPSEVSVKAMEGIEEWFTAVEEADNASH